MLAQEDRARQERLMAAERIRGAKTFNEDFKAMARAKAVQNLSVLGEQVSEHEPLWDWVDSKRERKLPPTPPQYTTYSDGGIEL